MRDHRLRRSSLLAAGLLAPALLVARHAGANSAPCPYSVSNGVATDVAAGLSWQAVASATAFGWVAANGPCIALGSSWRLPTILELQTIVDEGQTSPAIDATTFSGGVPTDVFFWSSTPSADDATLAWGVSFDDGNTTTAAIAVAHSVRCVRGG
jgi:Protein of unknown function (DUF1566)